MDERRNQARGANEWADTYGDLGNTPRVQYRDLPLNLLDPWTDTDGKSQPFDHYTQEEMDELVESIATNGVMEAIYVRPRANGRFQIIAGHHRTEASKRAGRSTIPAKIEYLDDNQAAICMVDSNLKRRKKIKPSNLAFAYKIRMEAVKKSAVRGVGRPTKNSSPLETNFRSDATVAEESGESRAQIQRYIRLTKLVRPLLDLVDAEKLALRAGVELSYLPEDDQRLLLEVMLDWKLKAPSMAQASQLRDQAADGELTVEQILGIMVKPKAPKADTIKLPAQRISSFFPPNTSVAQMELEICAALEAYRKNNAPASA